MKKGKCVISAPGAPIPSSRPCVVRRRPLNEETGGNIDKKVGMEDEIALRAAAARKTGFSGRKNLWESFLRRSEDSFTSE